MKYKDLLYVFDYAPVFDVKGFNPVFDMNNEALSQTQTDSKIKSAFFFFNLSFQIKVLFWSETFHSFVLKY